MRATKPDKPYKDFPLTAHPNGTWCKKIKGKLHHFGGWADPAAAVAKYRHQVEDLQAGRDPSPMPDEGGGPITMVDLCEEFLNSKEMLVKVGRLSERMLFDYHKACKRLLEITGKNRTVESFKPKDFDAILPKLAHGVGPVTLANRIRMTRIIFKFACDQDFIEHPVKFGQNFVLPDKAMIREERNKQPERSYSADEIRKLIDKAKSPLKAMILLGINCGFGQTDCSKLPLSALDLSSKDRGWLNFPRPKTHVVRRCPLWPETVKALKQAIEERPTPKSDEHTHLVFITKYGAQFVKLGKTGAVQDAVAGAFAKLLKELKIARKGNAFYSLRRTFETIGGDTTDQVATDFIMGHAPDSDDMGAVYRTTIFDDRLIKVVDHVHNWLWSKPMKKKATKKLT